MQVINCKVKELQKRGYNTLLEWTNKPNHLYIGRDMSYYCGEGARGSKWRNPFPIKNYTRDECLQLYEHHVRTSYLWNDLHELKDVKEFGCWCYPEQCHGNVLMKLVKEKFNQK